MAVAVILGIVCGILGFIKCIIFAPFEGAGGARRKALESVANHIGPFLKNHAPLSAGSLLRVDRLLDSGSAEGPRLRGEDMLDPWGQPYWIEVTREGGSTRFVVLSAGPDGECDTEDDMISASRSLDP